MIKDIILGWLECFGKKYFVVGYVLEAPQNKSQKLFLGGHPSDFTQGSPHEKSTDDLGWNLVIYHGPSDPYTVGFTFIMFKVYPIISHL